MATVTENEREMSMEIYSSSNLVAPTVLFALAILFFRWIWRSSRKLPPGPRGLPILGYLPFLRDDVHNQFIELADKYGPIYKLWLGNKLCVVISSESLMKELLRDNDTVFSNRDLSVAARVATLNINDIAACPFGPEWRDRKKLVVHDLLSNSGLDKSYNLRKDELRKTIRHVCSSRAGTTVDVSELIHVISINMMTRMAWGSTIQGEARDGIASEFLPWLTTYLEVLAKFNISDYFPILPRFDFQKVGEEMISHMKWAESIIGETIDEAMKRKRSSDCDIHREGWTDFIQTIVDLKEKDYQQMSLTKTEIIAIFLNIISSGHDSSTAINWVMAELLNNPEVMEKVKKEIDEVVELNSIVEESHVSRLVYLDAVIKESMRLHPSAPFLIPRFSSQPCTLGGYFIPKDTVIFPNVLSAQKNPLVFDNPYEFRPERFLDNSSTGTTRKWDFMGNNFNFLPFGSGRRRCPGIPLAERMMRYVLASLVHSFDWQLPCGEELDMSDTFGINTLTKRTPLCAIPVPRLVDSNLYV